MRAVLVVLGVLAAAIVAAGCGDDGTASGEARLTVVATTSQVADLVRNVGGERVDVRQILSANADPHDYEPRPGDARALAAADVVLASGGDVDEWLGDLLESAGGDARSTDLIDSVARRGEDPHWWQDPRNAERAVTAIAATLVAADPRGGAAYERRANRYIRRLRRLDRDVAACIGRIPAKQRKLVTTHDALGYYADRYGLDVIGALIPSLSTAAQPSAKDTEQLVDQIRSENVAAIFPESSLNPKLEDAVARETGATVGAALYADTLGKEGSAGATYIGSIAANTAAIVDGLTGGAVSCRP